MVNSQIKQAFGVFLMLNSNVVKKNGTLRGATDTVTFPNQKKDCKMYV